MIRVSGVEEQIEAGVGQRSPDGRTPQEQLQAIRATLLPLVAERQRLITKELLPALARRGHLCCCAMPSSTNSSARLCATTFVRDVFPVLTPLAIDPGHRFPFVSNLSVNLLIVLDGAQGEQFARVKVPEGMPRLVRLPGESRTAHADSAASGAFRLAGRSDRRKPRRAVSRPAYPRAPSVSCHARRRYGDPRRRSVGPARNDGRDDAPAAVRRVVRLSLNTTVQPGGAHAAGATTSTSTTATSTRRTARWA